MDVYRNSLSIIVYCIVFCSQVYSRFFIIQKIIFLFPRMAPGDWENPHPCNLNPEELENIWNLKNCLWLTGGSIMNQGSDILPRGISSRLVTSMWWFFALIVTNSYIASLAAFLTVQGLYIITAKCPKKLVKFLKITPGHQ